MHKKLLTLVVTIITLLLFVPVYGSSPDNISQTRLTEDIQARINGWNINKRFDEMEWDSINSLLGKIERMEDQNAKKSSIREYISSYFRGIVK
ncbi:MAG: hypothetical protein IE918_09755 [Campylobacterales bacterium]|nr:hypothetical protein [Campylobacterales bacterium]